MLNEKYSPLQKLDPKNTKNFHSHDYTPLNYFSVPKVPLTRVSYFGKIMLIKLDKHVMIKKVTEHLRLILDHEGL